MSRVFGTGGSSSLHGRPIRAGVLGLGGMGRHHARVYAEMPGVHLVGVADVDARAVAEVAGAGRVPGYGSLAELVAREQPDLLSIAVPTGAHRDAVVEAAGLGIHVLIEKPIAGTLDEAREMTAAAEQAGVRLMVGHVERFNPAVVELKRRLHHVGAPYRVSARRVGPLPQQVRDVGVVLDLATHDIDTMRFVLGRSIRQLYAETAQHLHDAHEDLLVGLLRFEGNVVGVLDINWLSSTKVRELSVTGSEGTLTVDYLSQTLTFTHNSVVEADFNVGPPSSPSAEAGWLRWTFPRCEPLAAELRAFVSCVRDGSPSPVSPEDAAETLAVALALLESAVSDLPVRFPAPRPTGVLAGD